MTGPTSLPLQAPSFMTALLLMTWSSESPLRAGRPLTSVKCSPHTLSGLCFSFQGNVGPWGSLSSKPSSVGKIQVQYETLFENKERTETEETSAHVCTHKHINEYPLKDSTLVTLSAVPSVDIRGPEESIPMGPLNAHGCASTAEGKKGPGCLPLLEPSRCFLLSRSAARGSRACVLCSFS